MEGGNGMYCERCKRLTEGEICPECGKACHRDALPEDPCFLLSGGQIWVDMACELLDQEKIPYLKQGSLGAAMTALTGFSLEQYSLYVPFAQHDRAKEITQAVFPEGEEAGEEECCDDDPDIERESEDE